MDIAVVQTSRDVLVSAHDWQPSHSHAVRPGVCGGGFMECVQTGRTAWLKPAATGPGGNTSAKEKIVSDLAPKSEYAECLPCLCMRMAQTWAACRSCVIRNSTKFWLLITPVTGAPTTLAQLPLLIFNLVGDGFDSGVVALDARVRDKIE